MTKNETNVMIDQYEGKLRKLRTALREARRMNRDLTTQVGALQDVLADTRIEKESQYQRANRLDTDLREARRANRDLTIRANEEERQFQRAKQLNAALHEAQQLNVFYREENEQLHTRLQHTFPVQPKPSWQAPFQPRSVVVRTPRFAPAPVGTLYANGKARSVPA